MDARVRVGGAVLGHPRRVSVAENLCEVCVLRRESFAEELRADHPPAHALLDRLVGGSRGVYWVRRERPGWLDRLGRRKRVGRPGGAGDRGR